MLRQVQAERVQPLEIIISGPNHRADRFSAETDKLYALMEAYFGGFQVIDNRPLFPPSPRSGYLARDRFHLSEMGAKAVVDNWQTTITTMRAAVAAALHEIQQASAQYRAAFEQPIEASIVQVGPIPIANYTAQMQPSTSAQVATEAITVSSDSESDVQMIAAVAVTNSKFITILLGGKFAYLAQKVLFQGHIVN